MGGSFTFGSWQNLDFCFILYRKHKELGGVNVTSHVLIFFFFFSRVLFTFPEMEVLFFYCTFWYLFESNVIVWLYFTSWLCLTHLGSELSKCFQNKQFNFSLVFLDFILFFSCVTCALCCKVAWLQGEIKRDFLPIVSLSVEICKWQVLVTFYFFSPLYCF